MDMLEPKKYAEKLFLKQVNNPDCELTEFDESVLYDTIIEQCYQAYRELNELKYKERTTIIELKKMRNYNDEEIDTLLIYLKEVQEKLISFQERHIKALS